MHLASRRPLPLLVLALAGLLAALCLTAPLAAPASAAPSARASAAGPALQSCAKSKRPALCRKQNKDNRLAFNQIKDRTFTGVRGDGDEVEQTFCANGRYESRVTDSSYGTGISKGSNWKVEATVKQGGKSITAFVTGQGGFEVALVKQAGQWQVAVASLDRVLYPGPATRTAAGATCAAL